MYTAHFNQHEISCDQAKSPWLCRQGPNLAKFTTSDSNTIEVKRKNHIWFASWDQKLAKNIAAGNPAIKGKGTWFCQL
jgi:hypothetical protein